MSVHLPGIQAGLQPGASAASRTACSLHSRSYYVHRLLLLSNLPLRFSQRNNKRKPTPKWRDFVVLSNTASGGRQGEWKLWLYPVLYRLSIEWRQQLPAFITRRKLRRHLLSGITICRKHGCLTKRKSRSNQVGIFRNATIGRIQSMMSSETTRQRGRTNNGG